MMNDLKNTLLIGLTVLTLGFFAWWLDPQHSSAQQQVETQAPPVPEEPEYVEEDDLPPIPGTPGVLPPDTADEPPPSVHHLLGMNKARFRLGRDVPDGEGITVGHVEIGRGQYLPNTRSPLFRGVTFVERSGESKVSGHAFATARVIYGYKGLAPGVSVVHCYEARDWMVNYLNVNSPEPPSGGPLRVLTHSWVSDASNAVDVLRRVDWQVDMHDTIICAGVNNKRTTPVPYLLGTAYNVIAVGTSQPGGSSGGYTRIEVPGRCKPDIVGPSGLTSFTTPAIAACAARLLEAADSMTDDSHRAGKAEVIKAVLMAGALKPRYWEREPDRPLDQYLGAGVANFDNSLRILQAGPVPEATTNGDDPDTRELPNRLGWDFREMQPDGTRTYTFETSDPLGEASVILTWHRRITGTKTGKNENNPGIWFGLPKVADLDLRLYHTSESGEESEIAVSRSKVDNVEHIYLTELPPGRYRLVVMRPENVHNEPWDYALAWRFELLDFKPDETDEPEEMGSP